MREPPLRVWIDMSDTGNMEVVNESRREPEDVEYVRATPSVGDAMSELLPCPFGGGMAIVEKYNEEPPAWVAHCTCCDPEVGKGENTERDAIVAWNTRAQPPAVPLDARDEFSDNEDWLHFKICEAVALMNQDETRPAHDLLRQALCDYADKVKPQALSSTTPATSEAQTCTKCGHHNIDRQGRCKFEITHPKHLYGNYPVRYCGCKCVFPDTKPTSGAVVADSSFATPEQAEINNDVSGDFYE